MGLLLGAASLARWCSGATKAGRVCCAYGWGGQSPGDWRRCWFCARRTRGLCRHGDLEVCWRWREADAAGSLWSSRATQRLWIVGPCAAAGCAEVAIRGVRRDGDPGAAAKLVIQEAGSRVPGAYKRTPRFKCGFFFSSVRTVGCVQEHLEEFGCLEAFEMVFAAVRSAYDGSDHSVAVKDSRGCWLYFYISSVYCKLFLEEVCILTCARNFGQRKCTVNYVARFNHQAWLGKEVTYKEQFGDERCSFNELLWYKDAVERTNPGSVVELDVTNEGRFKRFFICYHACIVGFQTGCRPLLFLDKTFLKDKYQDKLLVATALNEQNELFPLAYAACDAENEENWTWFLTCLKKDISIDRQITFISDRCKGLLQAIPHVFSNSHNAFCLRHLADNFAKYLRGKCSSSTMDALIELLKKAAYVMTAREFEKTMVDMRELCVQGELWARKENPNYWDSARGIVVNCSNGHLFEVLTRPSHVVDLQVVRRLPCKHVRAVTHKIGCNVEAYCSLYFSTQCYQSCYVETIKPISNQDKPLVDFENVEVKPPTTERRARRPKKNMIPSQQGLEVKMTYTCSSFVETTTCEKDEKIKKLEDRIAWLEDELRDSKSLINKAKGIVQSLPKTFAFLSILDKDGDDGSDGDSHSHSQEDMNVNAKGNN
ncbi:hypothetical protein Taro_037415 [Colocasia esculenta]|uniref:MULE transposase domain-containing protein n=1 Tax=Colocasia esculenta TaxID=4460 RepID=A0A843WG71_COLES|nr:hypothetical protein [Colocasia esculenta]